ncbi:ATP-binding protein [Actinomycetospora lemnae]|uniref:AAA family ATPase n=1 Tax=Actinomycetospora lemnae TaxID=3019891 RepID=A0ABT5T0J2_9PSEU|nr:helix-turn-helix transcriptional regulator [Actinomycetospora sp. DW7H6]MDD7968640.1 AAA family ATPase [Actinomycetospora sp. DW7H6]
MLHGRDPERARLGALVDDARHGRGGALVVRGDPGVGKSALLDDAAAGADGLQVLRTRGIASEAPLAFAALHRLLRPVARHIPALPAPQARALRAAFGEVEGDGGDRFLVFLAALSVLAEAAEETAVLCVVDDAHWLDDESAAALLFVARRVHLERIAVLFAARDGDVRDFASDDLPVLALAGLDDRAAGALLSEHARGPVAAPVHRQLVERTGGNPLALLELPDALTPEQLAGHDPLPDRLPRTEAVERGFLDRYRRLPDDAQSLLLVAALDDSARTTTVRRAAALLDVGDPAFEAAERSGLLSATDGRVELRHPLVRSAVHDAATSSRRRQVHAALATVLAAEDDPDRRAWHLAAAADGPDPEAVAALDGVARRAQRTGGLEAAAAAWARAAELCPVRSERGRLRYAGARAAWLAGRAGLARDLADTALRDLDDPASRADVARLRARVEWNTGSPDVGQRMVLLAAREVAPTDPDRAREMAMFAAALASFGVDAGVRVDPVGLVPRPAADDTPRRRCFDHLLVGLDAIARGDGATASTELRAAFAVAEELGEDDQDLLPNLGIAALQLGDDDAAQRWHELLLSRARATGAMVMVLYSLTRLGLTEFATGRWTAAGSAASDRALQLARDTGQPGLLGLPLAVRALVAVLRDEDGADEHAAAVEQVAACGPMGILDLPIRDVLHWAHGVRASSPDRALRHLSRITSGLVARLAAVDRLEAAVHAGEADTARRWVADLAGFAATVGTPWVAAAAAHGRALLADAGDAGPLFEEALARHDEAGHPFDHARTALAYGEHLRRSRRRVDARTHLRRALELFDELGATRWSERARSELRASGESARRRDADVAVALTPQELQVARLVGSGTSTREVAAQLFLSPRTIDFHLRNVFAKTGVSSRAELAHLPLG